MPPSPTTIRRDGRSAIVHLHGDLIVQTARVVHAKLRATIRRRNVRTLVLDFSYAGRIDSAGLAVLSLIHRQLAQSGKQVELVNMTDQHRAALALLPDDGARIPEAVVELGALDALLERLGTGLLELRASMVAFARLVAETVHQLARIVTRRARLPAGSVRHHLEVMGVEGIFIVSLLSFLTGMTMAFQGAVQLQRFGAGVFVADMIGMSMVRELVPLMTAVIITGRTGAAIAAELGTMQVRSEIDALSTMGINPVRFLIVPRFLAITVIGPALTLIGIFVGILGGMLVASATLDLPAVTFWARIVDRVVLLDFMHGLGKSLVFSWIIGFTASHMGLRAGGDASSVGTATTKTVVTSVFFIILVDAIFATITTFMRHG
jgi:phospholipid/cholesterol/gamma-HCH transport system permease protein